jgi:hypothetical protein
LPEITLFGDLAPTTEDVGADDHVTLGTEIPIKEDCALKALRFYKHANNTGEGTRTGAVWEAGNPAPLVTVDFTGETPDGWQEQALDTPLVLSAGTTYIIGVTMPWGHWSSADSPVPYGGSGNDDDDALTLGLRFQASKALTVSGVAFALTGVGWPGSTEDITVKIWSNDGLTQHASGTASVENVNNWARVAFDTPFTLTPGTPYVATFHNPQGTYRALSGWLAAPFTREALTALADDSGGDRNGVFVYDDDPAVFPTNSGGGAYYAIDLVVDGQPLLLALNGGRPLYTYAGTIEIPSTAPTSIRFLVDAVLEHGAEPEPEPEEPEQEVQPAGKPKKRRLFVEIDGQEFDVDSPDHARALLERAKEVARAHAEALAKKAVPASRKVGRKPVALPTPRIVSPDPELREVVREARNAINEVYRSAALDTELALLLARRLAEEDEEEALLLLM